jgi:cell division septation protein DedD
MKKLVIVISGVLFLFFYSCSSSVETTEEEETSEDEIYIFDEVPEDTFKTEQKSGEIKPLQQYFAVQIGAFTTRDRAETFASESRMKLNMDVDISYNSEVNLFVVRLKPYFKSKLDAEKLRNELWNMGSFNDAWIVTLFQ